MGRRAEPPIDSLVEQAGRWTAARTTRRSFLGRVGRTAMLVAAGPVVANLLMDEAEARVCGQSGVSPLCPTFDCNDVWGWCWYARGCCAGGELKKICDCCAVNWPNVHGYCPSGANVRCIVESCGTDPRLQTVVLRRIPTDANDLIAAAVRAERFPNGSGIAVLADGAAPLTLAVAMPLGAVLDAPVLPVGRGGLHPAVADELRRLGAHEVKVVGAELSGDLDAGLAGAGFAVERVGVAPDIGPFSEQVSNYIRSINGVGRTVCVANTGLSREAAPLAAGFASLAGLPLVVGIDAAKRARVPSWLVGPELAGRAGGVPGSDVVSSGSLTSISIQLADVALARGFAPPPRVVLAPRTFPALTALVGIGAPVVLHEPGTLGDARDWLFRRQAIFGRPSRAFLVGAGNTLGSLAYKELQSILNGFEIHKLVGVGGEGLPVIPQPPEERPIGRARLTAPPPDEDQIARSTYWTSRGSR